MAAIPNPDGTFQIVLSGVQRKLLAEVCTELRAELEANSENDVLRRLFPTAHPDDPDQQLFYAQMTRDDLADRRIAALTTVIETAHDDELQRAQIEQWMLAVNAVRLVLGTRLYVSEEDDLDDVDPDDPDHLARVVYEFLGMLLGALVYGVRLAGPEPDGDVPRPEQPTGDA